MKEPWCWDTHFYNMSLVSSQSFATIQSFQWRDALACVFIVTMVNGSLPETRQAEKTFQDSELCGRCALALLAKEVSLSTPRLLTSSHFNMKLYYSIQGWRTVVAREAVQCRINSVGSGASLLGFILIVCSAVIDRVIRGRHLPAVHQLSPL